MWSYYGSKSKIVNLYPPPKHKRIIEPFAGTARYALKYWENDVLLVDKYDVIVKIWQWLQKCSQKDILGLPKFNSGDDIRTFNISEIEKLFLGFLINAGVPEPKNIVTKQRGFNIGDYPNLYKNIAKNLNKIKHWTIQLGTYDKIPNFEATWFIDPPYKFGGEYYRFSSKDLDFEHLSNWCKDRNGQSIVCENTKANWLPFKPMTKRSDNSANTHKGRTVEAIWSNHITNYDNEQMSLFGEV